MHTRPVTYWAALVRVTWWTPWSHTPRRSWAPTWSLVIPPISAPFWARPGAQRRSSASNALTSGGCAGLALSVAGADRDATMLAMNELRSGVDVLLEVLATEGVSHIFGNPGTTELPLIGALAGEDRFHYVLALHESVAAGMADGYAQATGRPSFLNVHTATGLGNAMGNLSNSRATGTPIVVTAGQQDRRHRLAEPFLSGNLTGMAAGLVKWAHEVHRTADLGPVLRRAFHDAASPPTGPVFVSVPMDVLQEEGEFAVPAASWIGRRAVPAALSDLAAAILAAPRARFAVVAGDEVARSGAAGALAALAERLGCRVYGTAMHSTLVFPTAHPLWAGALPADAEQVHAVLAG